MSHLEHTDRLVIEAIIDLDESRLLFETIIGDLPMKKHRSPESYHVTLGFIHGVHRSEIYQLQIYMEEFINNELSTAANFLHAELDQAGQFPDNDTIVIFIKNKNDFRLIQKKLRRRAQSFEGICTYDFSAHTHPRNYKPHISIGTGENLEIDLLNQKLSTFSQRIDLSVKEIRSRIL